MKEILEVCYEDYLTNGLGKFSIIRDDGNVSYDDPARWFDSAYQISDLDKQCLEMVHEGDILDIGCGTGVHLRYLQKHNRQVYGFDISKFSIELARKLGAQNVFTASFWDYEPDKLFDNVICMNGSIGFIGYIDYLEAFVRKCNSFTKVNGHIYIQGVDWRIDPQGKHKSYINRNIEKGIYPGTVRLHKEYGDLIEKEFKWVWIDTDLLTEKAKTAGFKLDSLQYYGAKYFIIFQKIRGL